MYFVSILVMIPCEVLDFERVGVLDTVVLADSIEARLHRVGGVVLEVGLEEPGLLVVEQITAGEAVPCVSSGYHGPCQKQNGQ